MTSPRPQQINVPVLVHLSCAAQLKSQIHPDGRAEKIADSEGDQGQEPEAGGRAIITYRRLTSTAGSYHREFEPCFYLSASSPDPGACIIASI